MPSTSRSSFMGDDSEAVSRLVAACQRPDFSCVPVVERELQPYFSDPEEEQKAVQEVQRKLNCNSRKNVRSGSPILNASTPQPIKGSRPHKAAKPSTSSGSLVGSPVCTSSMMVKTTVNRAASPPTYKAPVYIVKTPSSAGAAAACPAIFKSPRPSDLPMPSSALLRRLVTVTVPAVVCMMPPVALPVMAAA